MPKRLYLVKRLSYFAWGEASGWPGVFPMRTFGATLITRYGDHVVQMRRHICLEVPKGIFHTPHMLEFALS